MKAVVVASVKRHAIVVKIESMILGWESCDVTYGTVVISLFCILFDALYVFEYWCHCSAPIPKLKYHENDIWISKVGLLITRLAFLLLRKHCGVYHGTLSKESERGKRRGNDEDSVKKKFVKLHERATFIATYKKKLIDTNLDRQKIEYKCHLYRFLRKKIELVTTILHSFMTLAYFYCICKCKIHNFINQKIRNLTKKYSRPSLDNLEPFG